MASRKKAKAEVVIPENNKGFGDFIAIVLFATGIFSMVSFLSLQYYIATIPLDSTLQQSSENNLMGPLGHYFSVLINGAFGWSALFFPISCFLLATYNAFYRDQDFSWYFKPSSIFSLILAGLLVAGLNFTYFQDVGGGEIGALISNPLIRYFNFGGAVLVQSSLAVLIIAHLSRLTIAEILGFGTRLFTVASKFLFWELPKYACEFIGSIWQDFVSYREERRELAVAGNFAIDIEIPEPKKTRAPKKNEFIIEKPVTEPKKASRKQIETEIVEEEDEEYEEDTREVIVRRRDIQGVSKQLKKRKRPVFDSYCPPDFDILTPGDSSGGMEDDQLLIQMSELIEEKLSDFNILGKVTEVHPGPVITMFEFEPAAGVKVGKIASLQDDLAMSLKASAIRIIAPIPNKGTVGIEVPNIHRDIVRLREVFESPDFLQEEKDLSIALGKDIYGEPVVVDVASMPHLLLAGATGAGKSVCINTILLSLLFRSSPEDLGLILIDPKILELSVYDGIPHLRAPVVTVPKQAKAVLEWAVKEMNSRYRMMQKHGVRNIDGYNRMVRGLDDQNSSPKKKIPGVISLQAEQVIALGNTDLDLNDTSSEVAEVSISEELQTLPKIVIVIDEMADLMLSVGRDIEDLVARLAQKARAAGIHMILATQRPSVDVITGLIKANFPARISFRVTSRIDSRTILDSMGAERLLGKGDMLMMMPGAHHLKRVHGAFVSDQEVNNVIAKLKEGSKPQYDEEIMDYCARAMEEDKKSDEKGNELDYDELYDQVLEFVVEKGQASTSMIQRNYRIGYNRAARIMDSLERDGVIGPMDGAKPREVLMKMDDAGFSR